VGLTDSIPALAIPLKALNPLAGQAFHFGSWIMACFVLQGLFGALLVRITVGPWTVLHYAYWASPDFSLPLGG